MYILYKHTQFCYALLMCMFHLHKIKWEVFLSAYASINNVPKRGRYFPLQSICCGSSYWCSFLYDYTVVMAAIGCHCITKFRLGYECMLMVTSWSQALLGWDWGLGLVRELLFVFTWGQFWPPGIAVVSVHQSVRPSVTKYVGMITHHPFKLGSPDCFPVSTLLHIYWSRHARVFWHLPSLL